MSIKQLKEYADKVNIAEELDKELLSKISLKALSGFDDDLSSCREWLDEVKRVTEIASLKSHKKSTPLPNSANIKFPIIIKAAYEFSSRTYPEIVKDGKVVKCRVIGKDYTGTKQAQADRVSDYMNYQLLFQYDCWEQELDKSLTMLALIGFLCKKTYYDPVRGLIKSEICDHNDLIINCDAKSLQDAPRINHILHFKLNDLIEHARAGVFLEETVEKLINQYSESQRDVLIDLVEQHTFADLDDDKYEEPYIITFVRETGDILRIAPRFSKDSIKVKNDKVTYIDPDHYFTDYHFLTSPKGKFQSVGFGILMLHLNETVNTLLNQLTDAGQLANLQTGLLDSKAKFLESGDMNLEPGEFRKVKTNIPIKDAIHMVDYKEPSSVLFQLLGLLIQASRDLSSSTEVMSGSSSPENVKSGAMLALIEQAMKVFNSIQKRIYRSLCQEYQKVFKLNQQYLDPQVYVNVLDDELAVQRDDFDSSTVNVLPVADPNLSSDITRMAQAQFLGSLMGAPGVKPEEIVKYLIETAKIPNSQRFLLSSEEMQQAKQQPNPEVLKLQADIEKSAQELNIRGREVELEEKKFALDVIRTQSEITLNLAKADQAESSSQIAKYDVQLRALQTQLDHLLNVSDLNLQDVQHQELMQQADQQHQNEMSMRQQEVNNANQQTPDQGMA
jgi:chaperonin GroES